MSDAGWPTSPLERINGEIKQRSGVIGIFPNHAAAVVRRVGTLRAEQTDDWQLTRR